MKSRFFIILTTLIVLSSIYTSCEKENINIENEVENFTEIGDSNISEQSNVRYVTGKRLPDVIEHLKRKLEDVNYYNPEKNKGTSIENTFIDYSRIMEVLNKGENFKNYTLNFGVQGAKENEFYNLIIRKKENGVIVDPYVIKYTVDPSAMDNFEANNRNFKYFKGKYQTYSFERFFDENFLKSDSCSDGDINNTSGGGSLQNFGPGDVVTLDGGTNGLPITATFGPDSGSSVPYSFNLYNETGTPATAIEGQTVGVSEISVSSPGITPITIYANANYSYTVTVIQHGGGCVTRITRFSSATTFSETSETTCPPNPLDHNKSSSSCPQIVGEIGLLPHPILGCGDNVLDPSDNECYDLEGIVNNIVNNLMVNTTLTSTQIAVLNNSENIGVVREIEVFLAQNNSQENRDFIFEALNAISDGGEVNIKNKFIKSKDFIETKVNCVLEALINENNNLFRATSEAFTQDRSWYRLEFDTYNNPNDLAIARTALPDAFGIVTIRFNESRINDSSINLATSILHETIHAELHRIYETQNSGPNPLPTDQYNWYIDLWNIFENNNVNRTASNAEHTYMANYYVTPIASGLRQFDDNAHSLDNYRYFAWTGLEDYGRLNDFITQAELASLANLSTVVSTDSHSSPCE